MKNYTFINNLLYLKMIGYIYLKYFLGYVDYFIRN